MGGLEVKKKKGGGGGSRVSFGGKLSCLGPALPPLDETLHVFISP
jgi:hypothetical protein